MANADAPRGAIPVRHVNGAPYNGACRKYYVDSSESNNLFIGDFVALSGTGSAGGIPGAVRATAGAGSSAGDGPVGVIVGIENLTSDNLSRTYLPASTGGYILVADDPDILYEIQEDSDSSSLAVTDIGLNANIIFGTGSTTTGTSAMEIDSSTAATTATLDVRIIEFVQRADNEIGTNGKWLVKINTHPHRVAEGE